MGIIYTLKQSELLYPICKFFFTPIRYVKQNISRNIVSKQYIKGRLDNKKSRKNIWYLGVPTHDNLGDQAQRYCIIQWFTKHYPDYYVNEITTEIALAKHFQKYLKSNITPDDIIFFQSGYCSHEKHLDHIMHLKYVSLFKKNTIVFLPQTVLLKSRAAKNKVIKTLSNRENVLFLARDQKSYMDISNLVKNTRVELFPDIVTTLIGKSYNRNNRSGILLCVRNDKEKLYSDEQIEELKNRIMNLGFGVEISDTNAPNGCFDGSIESVSSCIENIIDYFSKFKLIITDRFHGTIFSLISNTPVVVIKTNDHKVVIGAEWFFKSIPEYVEICENLNDISSFIDNRTTKYNTIKTDFFDAYYDELYEIVQEIRRKL